METKCQEHFSLNVNASGDVIIAMRNIAHPYLEAILFPFTVDQMTT